MELYGKRGFGMWIPCQCPFHVILSCSVNVDERSPPTLLFIESFSVPLLGNQSYHSTFSFWLRRFLHIQNPSPMLLIISHFTAATACLLAASSSSSSSPFYAIQIDLWGHLPVPVFSLDTILLHSSHVTMWNKIQTLTMPTLLWLLFEFLYFFLIFPLIILQTSLTKKKKRGKNILYLYVLWF